MITQPSPAQPDKPFAFKLDLPPAAITRQEDIDAHHDTLRVAWEPEQEALAIGKRIGPEMEQIAKNPHLTDAGKRAEATKLALQALPKLNELKAKLDTADAALLAKAEQVQKAAAIPDVTESDERLAEA